jgi:hypothetical protein
MLGRANRRGLTSPVQSCERPGDEPFARLWDVPDRVGARPAGRADGLLPDRRGPPGPSDRRRSRKLREATMKSKPPRDGVSEGRAVRGRPRKAEPGLIVNVVQDERGYPARIY